MNNLTAADSSMAGEQLAHEKQHRSVAEKSEVEELQAINQQMYQAFSRVSIEARDLRRALRRSDADVVIVALAGIALLALVVLGMGLARWN